MPTHRRYATLAEALSAAAETDRGVSFIKSRDERSRLTYRQLYEGALQALGALQRWGIPAGAQVIVQLQNAADFLRVFWACVLGAYVPVPLSGAYREHALRFCGVWSRLQSPYLVTTRPEFQSLRNEAEDGSQSSLLDEAEDRTAFLEELAEVGCSQTETVDTDACALIQFSSGSTGDPKGVILSHTNVLACINGMCERTRTIGTEQVQLNWMPLTHDMGLIGFHLTPVVRAWNHFLMPPELFQRDPMLWVEELSANRVSVAGCCSSGLEHVLRHFRPSQAIAVDLSPLTFLMNGAEPVSPGVCARFLEAFDHFGLKRTAMFPVYGLAEASLGVTFPHPGEELKTVCVDRRQTCLGHAVAMTAPDDSAARPLVELGAPLPGCKLRIVHEDGRALRGLVVGRIQIRGESVTAGYCGDPRRTRRTLTADGWLDTGDLGFLRNGRLVVTGRRDEILFANGQNYYPADLERIAAEACGVDCSRLVATSCFDTERQRKVIMIFVLFRRSLAHFMPMVAKVKSALSRHLGLAVEHVLPVARLPRTTSGKIRRFRLAEDFTEGLYAEVLSQMRDFQHAAAVPSTIPPTPDEDRVIAIWEKVLHSGRLRPEDDFFEQGGDSLGAARMAALVSAEFGCAIPSRMVFEHPVVRDFAQALQVCEAGPDRRIVRAEPRESYPCLQEQKRLYAIQKANETTTAYNLPLVLSLRGDLDVSRLAASFRRVVSRRECLRARLCVETAGVAMRLSPDTDFRLDVKTAAPDAVEPEIAAFIAPFDLEHEPPFRAKLLDLGRQTTVLMFDGHHVFLDATSLVRIVEELAASYNGNELPPVSVSFFDVAAWHSRLASAKSDEHREYWAGRVPEAPPLDLPADYPRPPVFTFDADEIVFQLSNDETSLVKRFAAEQRTTVFLFLLTVFQVWLARLTGQQEVGLGTVLDGRSQQTANCVGMFVHTLLLCQKVPAGESLVERLRAVRREFAAAAEHAGYPLEHLAGRARRDRSRDPLFDAMFVFQNMEIPELKFGNVRAVRMPVKKTATKFDLTLEGWDDPKGLAFSLEYRTGLFRRDTAESFARHFKNLLRAAVADPLVPVDRLEMMDAQERNFVVHEVNDTEVEVGAPVPVHVAFEEQARRVTDAPAVLSADTKQVLTYGELNRQANALAWALRPLVADRPAFAGIYVERTPALIVAVLAVLKAGFAYVPIEPDWPRRRIQEIVRESDIKVVIASESLVEAAREYCDHVIVGRTEYEGHRQDDLPIHTGPDDLAYAIFTSGTEGRPKGVMIEHGALWHYVNWATRVYLQGRSLDFALHTSLAFDLTVTSLFVPLTTGNAVVVYPSGDATATLDAILEDPQIGAVKLTPAHLRLIRERKGRVCPQVFIVGGENLTSDLAREAVTDLNPGVELYNEYGPTEATVGCMLHRFQPDEDLAGSVPIGRPADNTQIYLLDPSGAPVGVGVTGEMYIAGATLARGYLGDNRLTASRFVPNPFRPGARMYRTGDLARRRANGDLVYLGRIDQQLKIRGHRVDPEEVCVALRQHPAVGEAIVFGEEQNGEAPQLHAYVQLREPVDVLGLRAFLASRIPQPLLPAAFSEIAALPTTINGKIDRRRLAAEARPLDMGVAFLAPQTELEGRVAAIWSDVLRVPKVGRTDNFFDLGGDSIKALLIASRCGQAGIGISVKDILQRQTIAELCSHPVAPAPAAVTHAPTGGRKTPTPVERWFWDQHFPQPQCFCQSLALRFNQPADENRLRSALQALVRHHSALQLNCAPDSKELFFNSRHSESPFPLQVVHVEREDYEGLIKRMEAVCRDLEANLDLEKDLLFQAALFRGRSDTLALVAHHFVVDALSWRILLEDLHTAYSDLVAGHEPKLPPATASVQEHADWLTAYAQSRALLSQIDFWKAMQASIETSFSVDVPHGEAHLSGFELGVDDTAALLRVARTTYGTDPSSLLLVALLRLLRRQATGEPAIELEGHGRLLEGLDLSRTVGWLTCMYPVRLNLPSRNAHEQIKAVKEQLRSIPDGGAGYGVLARIVPGLQESRRPVLVRLNYLGEFAAEADNDLFAYCPDFFTRKEFVAPTHPTAELEIDALVQGGKLRVRLAGTAQVAELAARYGEHLAATLGEVYTSRARQFTPSDFDMVRLKQAELDAMLT